MTKQPDLDDSEEWYLAGVRVALPPNEVALYALVLYSEAERDHHNRPLTFNGKIVFFRDIAHAAQMLALGDPRFRKHATAPSELSMLYEPLKALALIEHGEYDDSATVINCGKELLDFVAATGRTIPAPHRVSLETLLNYATFARDLSVYFDQADGGRRATLDALLRCFGAVWWGGDSSRLAGGRELRPSLTRRASSLGRHETRTPLAPPRAMQTLYCAPCTPSPFSAIAGPSRKSPPPSMIIAPIFAR